MKLDLGERRIRAEIKAVLQAAHRGEIEQAEKNKQLEILGIRMTMCMFARTWLYYTVYWCLAFTVCRMLQIPAFMVGTMGIVWFLGGGYRLLRWQRELRCKSK